MSIFRSSCTGRALALIINIYDYLVSIIIIILFIIRRSIF